MPTLSAVPIQPFWVQKILDGTKTWEIRSKKTSKLCQVALIRSGSGTVVATATICDVIELTPELVRTNAHRMGMTVEEAAPCVGEYAWVLEDVVVLKTPVRYVHPYGAVTWVTLDEPTAARVLAEAARSSSGQARVARPREAVEEPADKAVEHPEDDQAVRDSLEWLIDKKAVKKCCAQLGLKVAGWKRTLIARVLDACPGEEGVKRILECETVVGLRTALATLGEDSRGAKEHLVETLAVAVLDGRAAAALRHPIANS